jgi:hypothetical protein
MMKRPNRPAIVVVMAIMQIVFGSLGLLRGLCGVGLQLAGGAKAFAVPAGPQQPQVPDVDALLRAKIPHYELMQYGQLALGVLSGTVMILSGVGLLRLRPWGRRLTIGYACYNIAMTILGVVFFYAVSKQVMEEIFANMQADPKLPPQAKTALGITEAFATLTPLLQIGLLVYPIALLVVMFLTDVRKAFRGPGTGTAEEPVEDDEDDEEEFEDDGGADEGGRRPAES